MFSVAPSEFDSISTGLLSGPSTSTWIGQPLDWIVGIGALLLNSPLYGVDAGGGAYRPGGMDGIIIADRSGERRLSGRRSIPARRVSVGASRARFAVLHDRARRCISI